MPCRPDADYTHHPLCLTRPVSDVTLKLGKIRFLNPIRGVFPSPARISPVRPADRFFLRLGAAAGPSSLAGLRAVPSAGAGVAAALDVSRAAALDRLAAGHRSRSSA